MVCYKVVSLRERMVMLQSGQFNGGSMVMTEVLERECHSTGWQFNGGRMVSLWMEFNGEMVMLRRWSV